MPSADENLATHNITLPDVAPAPAALYVPYSLSGTTLLISGQLPLENGAITHAGQVGGAVSLEEGQAAARMCALNIIAQAKAACNGNLSAIRKVLKLEILVSATPDFTEPHVVANGASEVIRQVFGDDVGAHARVAYGVSVLPLNAAVEVAATLELA